MSVIRTIRVREESLLIRVSKAPEDNGSQQLWPSVGEYPVYDALIYHVMSHDALRKAAYLRAIGERASGKTVVDIGTGQDVNWARACVENGASKVYAIEEMESAFALARKRVQQLGLQSRIELILGRSTEVRIPERVDLCVSEIVGSIASAEGICGVLQDAEHRFIKAEGMFVPERCVTFVAPVCLPGRLYREPSFTVDGAHYVEAVMKSVGHPFDLRLCVTGVASSDCLSDPAVFEDLDFVNGVAWRSRRQAVLVIGRAGRFDGLLLWIRLWCSKKNQPIDALNQSTNWLPNYMPLFFPGIPVEAGDRLSLHWQMSVPPGEVHPDYNLSGTLETRGAAQFPFSFDSSYAANRFRANPFYQELFPSQAMGPSGDTTGHKAIGSGE